MKNCRLGLTVNKDPISKTHKVLLLFFGFISPAVTHLIMLSNQSFRHAMGFPRYQTGLIEDKLAFLLSYQSLAWLAGVTSAAGLLTFISTVCVIKTGDHSYWSLIVMPFAVIF